MKKWTKMQPNQPYALEAAASFSLRGWRQRRGVSDVERFGCIKALAFLLVVLMLFLLGCSSSRDSARYEGSLPYRFVATKDNFSPPSAAEESVWRFDASPGFDIRVSNLLTNYVSDALKQLGLPAVQTVPRSLGGHSEGVGDAQFVWSNFEWSDYCGSNLTVRTGAWAIHRDTNRVIFVFLSPGREAR